ncbi:MAG: hypothetical protein P1U54_03745 [Immundisolibacteraceae bacterium]|nr:hypothetical protein [Immundisolibacteraceae bacterium]
MSASPSATGNLDYSTEEFLAVTLAERVLDAGHLVVGANSPIPASAALLIQSQSGGSAEVTILGSREFMQFTDGGKELFDFAAQGRMDAFFVGGGQIDGQANINLVGIGDYPGSKLRLPGSFGSAYLYHLVPNVVLFRKEHSRRVLVPKVDFVSAPGTSPANQYRVGGPRWLVTELVVMEFNAEKARFRLHSIHPGHTLEEVCDRTGFEFDTTEQPPITPVPSADQLARLRGDVRRALAPVYPDFCQKAFGV